MYHPKCNQLKITYVIFVDLLLLSGADCRSISLLKAALDDFGGVFGLKPNLHKSNMFVCGVSDELKANLV